MFRFLKGDPKKKLEQQYAKKMEEAVSAQRNGDIDKYSTLSSEADKILEEIKKLEEK